MTSDTAAAPESPAQWTDADYAPALRQLQTLQDQVDRLRNTIPSMIETFAPPPTSNVTPGQMYLEFAKVSIGAMQDLASLRTSWQSKHTQSILEQARTSLQNKEDLDWEFVSLGKWYNLETLAGMEKDGGAPDEDSAVQLDESKQELTG